MEDSTLARLLGNKLNESLLDYLRADPRTSGSGTKVILAVTVDEGGWPRVAMLTPWQVFARDGRNLRIATYSSSTTTKNLRRNGLLTLIVMDAGMSYYVKGKATANVTQPKREASSVFFDVNVDSVFDDSMPGVRITQGIVAEGAAEVEPHDSLYRELSGRA